MQDNIYSNMPVENIIISIVLQNHEDVFVRAHKLKAGLIPSLVGKYLVIEEYRENAEKDLAPHLEFDHKGDYVNVPQLVIHHDLLTGEVLFGNGKKCHDSNGVITGASTRKGTPVVVRKGWYQAPNTNEWTNEPPAINQEEIVCVHTLGSTDPNIH